MPLMNDSGSRRVDSSHSVLLVRTAGVKPKMHELGSG